MSRRFLVPVALLLAVPIALLILRAPERASTVSLLPAPSDVDPAHGPRDLVMPPALAEPAARGDVRTFSEPRGSAGFPRERVAVEPTVPKHEPETLARGRVLDQYGEAWAQAVVELQPQFEWPHAREADELFAETGADGRFEFRELVPGEYRLRVSVPFTPGPLEACSISRGANDLGSVRLERQGARGSIRGELVAVGGADEEGPVALLTLRHRETRAELVGMVFEFNLFGGSTGRTGFAFDDVPAGPYELEVVALDGRRYRAARLAVEAPAEGLVLEAHPSELAPYGLRLTDARSGEAIEPLGVLRFLAGRWLPTEAELLAETDGPCIVLAEGHRPRRVERLGPFLRSEGGPRRFELELKPGWGRVVFFRDLSAAPPASADDFAAFLGPALAGVRVRAGGRELARSDATGLALLALERQPEGLTFELPRHRVVSSDVHQGMQLVLMARE